MLRCSHSSALGSAILLSDWTASLPECTQLPPNGYTHIFNQGGWFIHPLPPDPPPLRDLTGVLSVQGKVLSIKTSLIFLWIRRKMHMILPIKMLPPVFPLLWQTVLHHIGCWSCSPPLRPWWTRVPQSNIPESSWAALHPTEPLSSSGGQPGVEEWANANDTGGVSES